MNARWRKRRRTTSGEPPRAVTRRSYHRKRPNAGSAASSESQAEAQDRLNDAIRVNGAELRCRVVGEGGNLGCTQKGRVEFALNGGRINTDFIDNSAGVDCSDHEVNIKILLRAVMDAGELTLKQRDELLASMTDEVGELVLRDNVLQNLALSMSEAAECDLLKP